MNLLKLLRRRGVVYVSLTDNYVGVVSDKFPVREEGVEVEVIGDVRPMAFDGPFIKDGAYVYKAEFDYIISKVGGCTAPLNGYSAYHCFGNPFEDIVGREYTLYPWEVRGRVVESAKRLTWWDKLMAKFFPVSFTDFAKVSAGNSREVDVVGVLSASAGTNVGFFTPIKEVYNVDVEGYSYLFNEKRRVDWVGRVERIVLVKVNYGCCYLVEKTLYVRANGVNFVPGTSGSPVWVR